MGLTVFSVCVNKQRDRPPAATCGQYLALCNSDATIYRPNDISSRYWPYRIDIAIFWQYCIDIVSNSKNQYRCITIV